MLRLVVEGDGQGLFNVHPHRSGLQRVHRADVRAGADRQHAQKRQPGAVQLVGGFLDRVFLGRHVRLVLNQLDLGHTPGPDQGAADAQQVARAFERILGDPQLLPRS